MQIKRMVDGREVVFSLTSAECREAFQEWRAGSIKADVRCLLDGIASDVIPEEHQRFIEKLYSDEAFLDECVKAYTAADDDDDEWFYRTRRCIHDALTVTDDVDGESVAFADAYL